MYSLLLALLVILFLAVAFSLQNAEPIIIHFFGWRFEGSLVIILLTAMTAGVILTVLASLPSQMKKRRLIGQQQKMIAQLERKLAEKPNIPSTQDVVIHTPES
jgi:uncharacterized integral membrane protein